MKAIFIYPILVIGLLVSCTPAPSANESNEYKAPTVFGTGGEHSTEPDNEKD